VGVLPFWILKYSENARPIICRGRLESGPADLDGRTARHLATQFMPRFPRFVALGWLLTLAITTLHHLEVRAGSSLAI